MRVSPPQAPGYHSCKPCAIDRGIIEIQIHPGDEPYPSCGDGKRPEFTYCTPCARALRLINEYGRTTAQCFQDTASAARPSSPSSSGAPAASCSTGATDRQASDTPRHRPEQPQRASLVNVATMIVESVNASASTASWQWARRGTTTTASSTTGEHTSRNKPERTTHSEHQARPGYHRSRTACQIFQHTCRNSYAKRLRLSPPENRMTSRTRYRHIAAIHGSLHPGQSDEQQRQPRNLDLHQKRR